jgi:reactive intermediate/imine deaminase
MIAAEPRRLARHVAMLVVSLIVVLGGAHGPASAAADAPYPGRQWQRYASPEDAGWSSARLREAWDYAKTIKTAAVMVVAGGRVVDEWGETSTRYNIHSIRKSLLSALYGIHVQDGEIDLSKTLADLGIDDNAPSLTAIEKTATLRDVIEARSGVYHPALYETASMAAARPARGSHAPGTFWYYNNWDFNVLGTIFERLTRTNLFREFKARIADPIGMEDFRLDDVQYVSGADSVYPAYPFRLTARDMARFGLLFLRNGRWEWRQIVPEHWIKDSVTSYSDAGESGGYGYMWWVAANGKHLPGVDLPDGSYSARGAGGHYILVVPRYDVVIVHRVNTDIQGQSVSGKEFGELVKRILAARTATSSASAAASNGAVGTSGASAAQTRPAPGRNRVIQPEGYRPTPSPLSPAILAGDTLYLSGSTGGDPTTGELVKGGFEPEMRQIMANVQTVLKAAGMDLTDVVAVTAYLDDMANYARFNEIYREYFASPPLPTRSTVAVKALARGARIEMTMTAVRSK